MVYQTNMLGADKIEKSTQNFLGMADKTILEKAVYLGFWLQEISKKHGNNKTEVEFTKNMVSIPSIGGEKFIKEDWTNNFQNQEIKDICCIYFNVKNYTFNDLNIEIFNEKSYRYMFIMTPKYLHCLYRTQDNIVYPRKKFNKIKVKHDKIFENKTKVDLTKFTQGVYPLDDAKTIEKQYDMYLEKYREPEMMRTICGVKGLFFGLIKDLEPYKESYINSPLRKQLDELYKKTLPLIKKSKGIGFHSPF